MLNCGGARELFGYIYDSNSHNQNTDSIMKPNTPVLSLLAVTVLLAACGKKELEVSAPAPVEKDAASAAVVAEALQEVDAIVEAAQEEVAETIAAVQEEVGDMQAEAVAAVEDEVAEIQAEAMEEVSAVIDDVEQELTAAASDSLKDQAAKSLTDGLIPQAGF
jgi:F0F1-type ATP synthase membrane subunit b/b'